MREEVADVRAAGEGPVVGVGAVEEVEEGEIGDSVVGVVSGGCDER